MKFSELMLDMATGDASMYDAYIAEAVGKINVSHAVFEAAYKISELPEGEDFMIVQEAADAGLPTDQEGSTGLATESVAQELNAFFDLIVATAKKVKQSSDKDFKALVGLGKGLGVAPGENIEEFAANLSKAVVSNKGSNVGSSIIRGHVGSIELGSRKFLHPMYLKKLTKKYAQGMAKYMAAYGLSINDSFNDVVVKQVAGSAGENKISGVHGIATALSNGTGQIIDKSNTSEHGNKYRTNIAAKDIADLVKCVYAVRIVSDAVIQTAGNKGVKKNVMAAINGAIAGPSGKGKKSVDAALHEIDETIKFATPKLTDDVVKNIVTGYTDSVYALVEVSNGGRAPLPKKNNDKDAE